MGFSSVGGGGGGGSGGSGFTVLAEGTANVGRSDFVYRRNLADDMTRFVSGQVAFVEGSAPTVDSAVEVASAVSDTRPITATAYWDLPDGSWTIALDNYTGASVEVHWRFVEWV